MKKLIIKGGLYAILLLLMLEVLVRVFHLNKDNPTRIIDDRKVEKWLPNQNGYSVTGNRRQNFSEFKINNSGYNSYREYDPTEEEIEIALVGDSFIEGFHQHYYNSTGKKIEDKLDGIEVYEYGYAGYDMADQLHLINAYKEQFDKVDYVILGVKFSNDFKRGSYTPLAERMKLESPFYKTLRKSKLLVYVQSIGAIDPIRNMVSRLISVISGGNQTEAREKSSDEIREIDLTYIENFKSLINLYGFDKERFTFLLDSESTSELFIEYLKKEGINYLDFRPEFNKAKKPTTLIYDMHWNNYGRSLIAEIIADYIKQKE